MTMNAISTATPDSSAAGNTPWMNSSRHVNRAQSHDDDQVKHASHHHRHGGDNGEGLMKSIMQVLGQLGLTADKSTQTSSNTGTTATPPVATNSKSTTNTAVAGTTAASTTVNASASTTANAPTAATAQAAANDVSASQPPTKKDIAIAIHAFMHALFQALREAVNTPPTAATTPATPAATTSATTTTPATTATTTAAASTNVTATVPASTNSTTTANQPVSTTPTDATPVHHHHHHHHGYNSMNTSLDHLVQSFGSGADSKASGSLGKLQDAFNHLVSVLNGNGQSSTSTPPDLKGFLQTLGQNLGAGHSTQSTAVGSNVSVAA